MTPGSYNIQIPGNATYSQGLTYLDSAGNVVALSSYTAKMRIENNGATVIELTTANGMITLANTAPNITLNIPLATMEALNCPSGQYDLVIVSPGGIQSVLLTGGFVVVPGITP